MDEQSQLLQIQPKLADRWWRLNNLYFIIDENSNRMLFRPNEVQTELYNNHHYRNIILKSRQHGCTTLMCLLMLDYVLFNENKECAITTQGMTESKKIFRTKIIYPFSQLPDYILENPLFIPKKQTETDLLFPDEKNNDRSSLSAQVGLRSGTYHMVLISEYAKTCATKPLKAKEIQTGAFETVHEGQILTIESTAEGPHGDFYDKCKQAEQSKREHKPLGGLDWQFFFFAWFQKSSNRTDPRYVEITPEDHLYFDKLERTEQCKIDEWQRAWYVVKLKEQRNAMTQEHPSTSDEAFFSSVTGAFWADEIRDLERRFPPQITDVPHDPNTLVHTIHDVGYHWAIWFIQNPMGLFPKIIRHYEFTGSTKDACEMMDRYKELYGYRYGKHICPIDVDSNATKVIDGKTILIHAKQNGYNFTKMKKIPDSMTLIEQTRVELTNFWFDRKGCENGLNSLRSFRRKKDMAISTDKHPVYFDKYIHDQASHSGSALYHFVKARKAGLFDDDGGDESITIEEIRALNRQYSRAISR